MWWLNLLKKGNNPILKIVVIEIEIENMCVYTYVTWKACFDNYIEHRKKEFRQFWILYILIYNLLFQITKIKEFHRF